MSVQDDYFDIFAGLGGIRPITSHGHSVMTSAEIAKIEKFLTTALPSFYKKLLQEIGGFTFRKQASFSSLKKVPSTDEKGLEPFDVFYGAEKEGEYSLWNNITLYQGRIPGRLIPIGDNMFGDQICLGIRGTEREKVYFWDHEDERDEQDYRDIHGQGKEVPLKWLFGNVYLVANSLEDFLTQLTPD
jgi:hypothetical protein